MSWYSIRPIADSWQGPRTPAVQRRSLWTFKASHDDTLVLLRDELGRLDGENVVLQIDIREQDLRLDGGIRAIAPQPIFPGVRVTFDSRHGPLAYQTDTCERWQHNVRSIALGLQALRAVDRYGITRHAEQYTGWKALPPGSAIATPPSMTKTEALKVIQEISGDDIYTPPEAMWRRARAITHPDRHAGDRTRWDQVEAAARVLGYVR